MRAERAREGGQELFKLHQTWSWGAGRHRGSRSVESGFPFWLGEVLICSSNRPPPPACRFHAQKSFCNPAKLGRSCKADELVSKFEEANRDGASWQHPSRDLAFPLCQAYLEVKARKEVYLAEEAAAPRHSGVFR